MKTFTLLLILLCFVFTTTAQDKGSCRLTVKVENIKNLEGSMKFAIYNNHKEFLKTALTFGGQEIINNSVAYTFEGLEEGIYAVSIFQDENENDKLDTNFIGIPTEPYAFSNNAKGMFGPPSFEDCKFEIKAGQKEIVINL